MTELTPGGSPPHHRPELGPEAIQSRRRTELKLTVTAIIPAMVVSGWGMWTFFDDLGGIPVGLIVPMFLLFDLAAVTCAWGARINRIQYGRMGVQGWLVWLFAVASGLMSASDADGKESAVRFAAPMVAAILFELLIRGERHDLTNFEGPIARVRRRILARLGLLDDVDQDDESAARSRMAAKLATLVYRVHELPDGRARRRAVRRYHRALRKASVRMGFATNDAMIGEVRLHLDALYRSITATGPDSVADLNVWQANDLELPFDDDELTFLEEDDYAGEVVAANAQEAAPRVRFSPVRRPGRAGRLAGRPRSTKRSQPVSRPAEPASVAAPVQLRDVSALKPPADVVRETVKPKPKPKGKPKRSAANDAAAFDRAFQYWQSEIAAGRTPSSRQIATAVGVSDATGARYKNRLQERAS